MDWGATVNKAADMVISAGPWAAFCILLMAFCVFLVLALIKEARLNREVNTEANTILTRLATLIQILHDDGKRP